MIGAEDLITLRTALLITLSVLLVVVLWRKFRRTVLANDMPAISHVELLALEVAYHPARLHVQLLVPREHTVDMGLLNAGHAPLSSWPAITLKAGEHTLEQRLPELPDGIYFLEVNSRTQRTVRQFRLQRT